MTYRQHQSQHQNTDRTFVAVSTAAVLIAIVAGFLLLGSPGQQRLLSLDSERVNDLSQIASNLVYTVENPGNTTPAPQLPESLPASIANRDDLRDPLTKEPYEYRRLSDSAYELCATFATDSTQQDKTSQFIDTQWPHPVGRHCFEIAKSASQPKP
ncbi:MAG: hypothetical protein DCF15_05930 [Phormidesmis priestleyi]|uniref:Uncharacterized protein n=1 Tax=Phormidesmis priestleyi TaxID=268141 RepID=A0A2W4ZT72_9CYAN|nr:MAG: hypothetical protein DCF15_05930 [Phormidesmis priestleyi]